ncbi:pentatricopeptide repeat-containing protein At3g50420 [Punica granatum]|uniref:Uncharacterized protein n=2 Tax=Punica granatum TaxID=22663 RepID=A0A218WJ35_PUNGR|nr:pentatricopeptide repeat-containing protein At3g50420 [Punica granatum]OWM72528.1 hypothetical protein CDL15_Pgr018381 [Punica granatum]PKI54337.1 hypothetical protein CRG98_025273 [Punica granatum]
MRPYHYWESSFLAALIRKCSSVTSLREARRLHALILTAAPNPGSPFLNNNLISMYSRCGSMDDARQLFDRMPLRTTVSYNAAITAYSRAPGHAFSAFELLTEMGAQGLLPDAVTFTSLIQASTALGVRFLGSSLHGRVVKMGFLEDRCIQTSVLGMYSSYGDLESAERVFRFMVEKDAVAWNSMILGNLRNERVEEGLRVFLEMLVAGVSPTPFTYSMVLNACSRSGDHISGRLVHGQIITSDSETDLPLQNALLDMYCSCRDTSTAAIVFSKMENPDLVSWNSIISGYAENGYGDMAIEVFIMLRRNSSCEPDEYTFAAALHGSSALSTDHCGRILHGQVIRGGFECSVYVGSTLVSMYFSSSENESARKVFNCLSEKDIVLWTEMITAHSRMGDAEGSIKFFFDMFAEGRHKVDSFALSGALSSCGNLAILKQGEMIHSQAIKTGNNIDDAVSGSLIDMYAKNGNLQAAESIFSSVSSPDLKCWNSMVGGYSNHGLPEKALALFEKILLQGMIPDQVTFLSVLSACSHSCLVEKGKSLWNYMRSYGVKPGPKHYSCMVSLLSRAGLVNEAEKIIVESPFCEGRIELWRTLLSSCVENRNLQAGVHAAEQVLGYDPGDSPTLILLSSLYAALGKWDQAAETRQKMRGLETDKRPGLSWIEANRIVHVFSSGDQSHPNLDETHFELLRLHGNMVRPEDDVFGTRIHHQQNY